jgi:pimeloyl-ACP methyl ester carboxylesterase
MERRGFLQMTGAGAATLALGGLYVPAAAVAREDGRIDAAAFHAMRRFAATRSGRVAYVERGAGRAALFFHGWPLNGFQWRGALERLSPYRRCIAPDFIGMGHSEGAKGQDVSPGAQAEMMAALLDTLGVDAVDVVCNDSGGTVAQLFAVRYPRRVRTILFTTCDVNKTNPPPAFRPVIDLARKGLIAPYILRPALANPDIARSPQSLGGAYTDPANLTDECIETYLAPLAATPERIAQFEAYTLALEPNVLEKIEPELKHCAAPARIIWGDAAPAFPVEDAQWLDRTLPHSRGVRIVPGAKLFFPEEMPDIIAEEAMRLWGS